MSPRRRARDRAEAEPSANTPAQQDEADIVQEVGAETDPETGALLTDEERIREIGATDAESVRDNRRHDDMVGKKRANVKNVSFNISDVLVQYDQLTRVWPPNSLYISVKRLTGTAIQQTITSCPRNGQELYTAMQQIHGQNAEASYELGFLDATTKQYRGKGNITMPDTRGPFAQGQPPMNPQNPYGYPPYPTQPPGYPAPAPQAAVPPSGYAAPPPAIPSYAAMAGMDINAFLALQKQQFEFWQAAKSGHASAPAANPLQHPGSAASPPDHAAFTAFLQTQFELWQQQARTGGASMQPPSGMVLVPGVGLVPTERILHALAAPSATVSAAQPAPQNPQGAMPPVQPPPGMVFVPGWGMVTMEALAQAQAQTAGVPRPAPSMAYRPAYGPRPAYYAGGGGGDSAPPGPTPYAAPQQPKTPAEQFREAVLIVEQAVSIADRFRPPAQAQAEPEPAVDDDNPIRIIEAGTAKVLVNRADGKLRAWETGWANLDKIFNFVKEQAEAYRKAQPSGGSQQQQQQQKPQLPPGYVEVTPGYVPPAGYVVGPPVAVPAATSPAPQAPEQQQLPDPPAQMPAPMQPAEEPPRRRSWGMPPTPGGS